jgi:DNA-binding transcriptional MerR regulator
MSTELDQEWIELIQIAIQMQIPIEEIKKILSSNKQ